MSVGTLVLAGHAGLALLASWGYFRQVRMARPPLGVFTRSDMVIVMGMIVAVPYAYLAMPLWLVGVVLGLLTAGIVYATLEPMAAPRWVVWLTVLGIVAADLASWQLAGPTSQAFAVTNNLVLTVVVVGVANVWAQAGMKARDLTLLGGMLTVYDLVFTAWLPVTDDLFLRVGRLPFAPHLTWLASDARWESLGLGDVLVAAAFPLVLRKAFGRRAGWSALVVSLAVIVSLLAAAGADMLSATFPLMVVLGPCMVVQYAFWIRRRGRERTMREYLQAEPLSEHGSQRQMGESLPHT